VLSERSPTSWRVRMWSHPSTCCWRWDEGVQLSV